MREGLTVSDDKVYTIEDYLKLDDGNRYELIGGKLLMVPSPVVKHQRILYKLSQKISKFVDKNCLGEVFIAPLDVYLGSQTVQPDIFFISRERLEIVEEYVQGAPDLIVEILSPATMSRDRKKKRKLYFDSGVKEYWMVATDDRLVEVLIAGEKEWRWGGIFDCEDVLTTSLMPGLEIKLQDVFI
ncbi:protein of unknown function DUF820 [Desulfofarcimen acetoxidans DSM 771]|jgi:Uma2 family endonuclease|uniref:Putative restriction endonuclease domain-containing protein n=1 Tax=Desulfofarcimen acetoxidans (strain ATCC 49208 / DSM 771 / KCTC 5769 / VKM B-1644 / 5575) TaxID=485916 RepID=C8W375_DESAS|nr:Uma2 family endonuclease [Desulfofarcimen acetoxidans]ACV61842.1 protein of unknown function DUF820 [Desulfofarcimen acetoxidans DSM 771]